MSGLWRIRDVIQNRWEVHDIKQGGMGVVYVVFDRDLKALLAAKTFRADVFARNPQLSNRFIDEAATWLNLHVHENVVRAILVEMIGGQPYLFLEYIQGGSLANWIGTPRLTRDLPQVLRFAIQFCNGMEHILSHGVGAHRDVKPANCLVTESGTLKVSDFGLAKAIDEDQRTQRLGAASGPRRIRAALTRTGAQAGTPAYMAPEQFKDAKHVDVRADLYSFGVMLCEMVTGRLPVPITTWEKVLWTMRRQRTPPQLQGQATALDSIVRTCLAPDPEDRYGNFSEIRDELARVYEHLTGEPAPAPATAETLEAGYWNNRGVSLRSLGLLDEAMLCLDRALEQAPNDAQTWYNKGGVLADQGQHAAAISCFERASQIIPGYAPAWYGKAGALIAQNLYQEALSCLGTALELSPLDPIAWYNKGAALAFSGQAEDAMSCLDRALDLNPFLAQAWYNKAALLAEHFGRHRDALFCFDQALAVNPRLQQAWYAKGTLLVGLGRTGDGLICLNRAIEIDPHWAEAWTNKGTILDQVGRAEEALSCYERALELNPNLSEAWYNKGATLAERYQFGVALVCLGEARRLGHPAAEEAIAFCREMLGEQDTTG